MLSLKMWVEESLVFYCNNKYEVSEHTNNVVFTNLYVLKVWTHMYFEYCI